MPSSASVGTISHGAMLAYSGLLQIFMISFRVSVGILFAGSGMIRCGTSIFIGIYI